MKFAAPLFSLALTCACVARAQTVGGSGVAGRRIDFTPAAETRVFRTGTSLPATCNKGAIFYKTDAPAGKNVYLCTDKDTWTQASAGVTVTTVAGLGSAATPQLAIVTDAANASTCSTGGGSAVVLCMANGSSWQPVGGGTSNHAALSNLDYASSGHTGFASSTHNHDSQYAALTHNHDSQYASISHNHAGVYEPVLGFTPENVANKGAPNGYAALNAGKVPISQLPVMVGDSGAGGTAGLVPAPAAGDAAKCLKGDATWGTCGTGSGLGTDVVGTDELNDGTDTPAPGDFVRVDSSTTTKFQYSTPAEVLTAIGAASATHNHAGVYEPVLGFTPENVAKKNVANGYAGLDGSSKLARAQLPVMVGDSGSGGQAGAVPAPAAGDAAKCLKGDGTWGACGGGGSGVAVQDEGVTLPQRPTINFIGSGVTCSDDSGNNRTTCSVPGGSGSGGSGPAGPLAVASDPAYNGERAFTPGNGLIGTDAGPNGTYTVRVDPAVVATQTGNNNLSGLNVINVDRLTIQIPNSASGTTQYYVATLTGAPSKAANADTSTDVIIGICVSGCGTTGTATIAVAGKASCTFDGATTAGHFVRRSTTSAGRCSDAGTSRPTTGFVGYVTTTNATAGTYEVLLVR
jgi:hypothetical protein